jgi:hypothetical protein
MTTASPGGTPLIVSVLSLVVAILAVFFGPLIARANVQRQIRVTAREAWLREFREQVAALLSDDIALKEQAKGQTTGDPETLEAIRIMAPRYNAIRLLVAERGLHHEAFMASIDRFLGAPDTQAATLPRQEFTQAVTDFLQRERATIDADPWRHALAAWRGRAATLWSRLWA